MCSPTAAPVRRSPRLLNPRTRHARRAARGALDIAKKNLGVNQKEIGQFMKKKETPPEELLAKKKTIEEEIKEIEKKEDRLGNLIGTAIVC